MWELLLILALIAGGIIAWITERSRPRSVRPPKHDCGGAGQCVICTAATVALGVIAADWIVGD